MFYSKMLVYVHSLDAVLCDKYAVEICLYFVASAVYSSLSKKLCQLLKCICEMTRC